MTRSVLLTLGRGVTWTLRVVSLAIEAGLLITGFAIISSEGPDDLAAMTLWDLLAILYLMVGLLSVWVVPYTQGGRTPGEVVGDPPPQRSLLVTWLLGLYWGLLPVVFSMLGLTAALSVMFMSSTGDHDTDLLLKGAGVVAMTTAWILLHVSYARRYRWIYRRLGGGLEFPGEPQVPTAVDFLYFSMTMGASFATSDVNVTHTRMRSHVIVHSVLSFFYNAVVLAVAFRIITGG